MGDASEDKRLAFLENYTLSTLKLKPDKWQKCIGVEENAVLIREFLDKSDQLLLILCLGAGGSLQPGLEFLPSGKTKAVYFNKRSASSVSRDNVKDQLMYGDMSYSPLDQMSAVVDDVSGLYMIILQKCTC